MCLYVDADSVATVVESDLEVYKVVSRLDNRTDYQAMYHKYFYSIGETHSSTLCKEMSGYIPELLPYSKLVGETYSIGRVEEGLHSFVNYEDAVAAVKDRSILAVLRCKIPAGSEYYGGKVVGFGSDHSVILYDSYASDTLTVVEEIA